MKVDIPVHFIFKKYYAFTYLEINYLQFVYSEYT